MNRLPLLKEILLVSGGNTTVNVIRAAFVSENPVHQRLSVPFLRILLLVDCWFLCTLLVVLLAEGSALDTTHETSTHGRHTVHSESDRSQQHSIHEGSMRNEAPANGEQARSKHPHRKNVLLKRKSSEVAERRGREQKRPRLGRSSNLFQSPERVTTPPERWRRKREAASTKRLNEVLRQSNHRGRSAKHSEEKTDEDA